jgi:hypothetical protein
VTSHRTLLVGITALSLCLACAGAKVGITPGGGSQSGGGGNVGGPGGAGSGAGGLVISFDAAPNVIWSSDAAKMDSFPDVTGCRQDDAGGYLCCPKPLSILSIGQPASKSFGASGGDSTNAFQAFMNGNTHGTAVMEMLTTFKHFTDPTLDLSKYDVIILQGLYNTGSEYSLSSGGLWAYNDADAAALRDWVSNQGGAIIAMSGYFSNDTLEIQPLNQLLKGSDSWSGITYNPDNTFNDSGCVNYCSACSVPFNGWTTNYADFDQITKNLKKVGVFFGRSINCTGATCQVFAKSPTFGNVGVAKIVGNGRVFAWGDEWVTYTSQWGLTDSMYDDPVKYAQCAPLTPKTSFSVPQFWYNAFRWAVPSNTCFTIIVPPTADPGQVIVY